MHRSSSWMNRSLALLVALAVLLAPLAMPTAHAQDALSQARSHYQKGTSLFSSGNYKGAIGEFAAADKLAPSALLEFNIALCYDRLGDRGEALRRYRVYLREMPTAQNRASVEGKIRRLEGEIRQEQDAERKRREAAAATAAAAAAAAAAAMPVPAPAPVPTSAPVAVNPEDVVIPTAAPAVEGPAPADVYTPGAEAGSTVQSAPSADIYASSDPDLARVAAIDVAAIREQRGASNAGANRYDSEPVPPRQDAPSASGQGGLPNSKTSGDKKASKPIYKQWWFWVVAGIGTIILIDFASSDSADSTESGLMLGVPMQSGGPAARGLEWRF